MKYPHTLSLAHAHGGQHDASGSVIHATWHALQLLFAGLCEPVQTAGKNPGAYPATFINLP